MNEKIELEKEKINNEIDELDSQRLHCEKLWDEKAERLCALNKELNNLLH